MARLFHSGPPPTSGLSQVGGWTVLTETQPSPTNDSEDSDVTEEVVSPAGKRQAKESALPSRSAKSPRISGGSIFAGTSQSVISSSQPGQSLTTLGGLQPIGYGPRGASSINSIPHGTARATTPTASGSRLPDRRNFPPVKSSPGARPLMSSNSVPALHPRISSSQPVHKSKPMDRDRSPSSESLPDPPTLISPHGSSPANQNKNNTSNRGKEHEIDSDTFMRKELKANSQKLIASRKRFLKSRPSVNNMTSDDEPIVISSDSDDGLRTSPGNSSRLRNSQQRKAKNRTSKAFLTDSDGAIDLTSDADISIPTKSQRFEAFQENPRDGTRTNGKQIGESGGSETTPQPPLITAQKSQTFRRSLGISNLPAPSSIVALPLPVDSPRVKGSISIAQMSRSVPAPLRSSPSVSGSLSAMPVHTGITMSSTRGVSPPLTREHRPDTSLRQPYRGTPKCTQGLDEYSLQSGGTVASRLAGIEVINICSDSDEVEVDDLLASISEQPDARISSDATISHDASSQPGGGLPTHPYPCALPPPRSYSYASSPQPDSPHLPSSSFTEQLEPICDPTSMTLVDDVTSTLQTRAFVEASVPRHPLQSMSALSPRSAREIHRISAASTSSAASASFESDLRLDKTNIDTTADHPDRGDILVQDATEALVTSTSGVFLRARIYSPDPIDSFQLLEGTEMDTPNGSNESQNAASERASPASSSPLGTSPYESSESSGPPIQYARKNMGNYTVIDASGSGTRSDKSEIDDAEMQERGDEPVEATLSTRHVISVKEPDFSKLRADNADALDAAGSLSDAIQWPAEKIPTELHDMLNSLPRNYHRNPQMKYIFESMMEENTAEDEPTSPRIEIYSGQNGAICPPWEFYYTNRIFYGKGVPRSNKKLLKGCDCDGPCDPTSQTCACVKRQMGWTGDDKSIKGFLYNKKGKILNPGYPIFECNDACECSEECMNRVIQRGRQHQISICLTDQKGWGVHADEKIPRGTYLGIYSGEMLLESEAAERGKLYDRYGRTYLFDLDFYYLHSLEADKQKVSTSAGDRVLSASQTDSDEKSMNLYTIDAFHVGNFTRFLNHSCDPNCVITPSYVNEPDLQKPTLTIFTTRDVKKGEELCFSYFGNDDEDEDEEEQVDEHGQTKKVVGGPGAHIVEAIHRPCLCGAPNCRGKMF